MRKLGAALAALAACSSGESNSGPTFYRHVEPLLQRSCDGCHVEGGIAPFALDGYDAAKAHLHEIVEQVSSRTMPPWPPGPAGVPLLHSRALADGDIDTIVAW